MENRLVATATLDDIQTVNIELIALRMLLETLKSSVESVNPKVTEALATAKKELLANLPRDSEGSIRLRDRIEQMLHSW